MASRCGSVKSEVVVDEAPLADRDLCDRPLVSVVLPIRNEAAFIEACLQRLLDQDYPRHRMEILIVDGDSDDDTVGVVRTVQAHHPDADVRILANARRIVPPALNIGIRAARGSVIVRMDGHSVPARDYVTKCVEALRACAGTRFSVRTSEAEVGFDS